MIVDTFKSAIKDVWPMLVIFLVVVVAIRLTYILANHEKFVFYQEILNLLFVLYALLLFQLLTSTEINTSSGLNIVPFTEIFRYETGSKLFLLNVVGNIAIFVPFGYFVSRYVNASKISHILLVGTITSLTVELVQLQIGRSFDVDDILLNVIGSIIGFLLFISISAIKKHLPKFFRSDMFYNILWLVILAALVFYFVEALGIRWN